MTLWGRLWLDPENTAHERVFSGLEAKTFNQVEDFFDDTPEIAGPILGSIKEIITTKPEGGGAS